MKQREIHINHCIDILLQEIQCNANLDLIPLHWVETQEYPFPDMYVLCSFPPIPSPFLLYVYIFLSFFSAFTSSILLMLLSRSINKKCVNFDGLTEWRKEHTIDMDKYVKVMQMPEGEKPGIKQLPAADQYYEYFGYDNPNHKPKPEGHGLPLDVDSNL